MRKNKENKENKEMQVDAVEKPAKVHKGTKLTMIAVILILVCVGLLAYTKISSGPVKLGDTLTMSKEEYSMYEEAYPDETEERAHEMAAVESALNELGITATDEEVNERVYNEKANGNYEGKSDSYIFIQSKVGILMEKATEYFVTQVDVNEDEITAEVADKPEKYRTANGEFKVVSPDSDAYIIENGIGFSEMDERVDVIDSGHMEDVLIDNPSEVNFGDVVQGYTWEMKSGSDENKMYIWVDGFTENSDNVRANAEDGVRKRKATQEFNKLAQEAVANR